MNMLLKYWEREFKITVAPHFGHILHGKKDSQGKDLDSLARQGR